VDVKVETFTAKGLATGKDVTPRIYRVRVDGMVAGFIGWQPDAKLTFHRRYSPIECAEIEKKVAESLAESQGDAAVEQVESVTPPAAPEGFFRSKTSANDDDLDDLEL
jgi:hypothetical protein